MNVAGQACASKRACSQQCHTCRIHWTCTPMRCADTCCHRYTLLSFFCLQRLQATQNRSPRPRPRISDQGANSRCSLRSSQTILVLTTNGHSACGLADWKIQYLTKHASAIFGYPTRCGSPGRIHLHTTKVHTCAHIFLSFSPLMPPHWPAHDKTDAGCCMDRTLLDCKLQSKNCPPFPSTADQTLNRYA